MFGSSEKFFDWKNTYIQAQPKDYIAYYICGDQHTVGLFEGYKSFDMSALPRNDWPKKAGM